MRIQPFITLLFGAGLMLALAGEPARAAPNAGVALSVSNPSCMQAQPFSGTCTINIRSISAATTDTSFSHVEVSVNGKVRVYMSGFFETSANLSEKMLGEGLKVACGVPNASGNPNYGYQYQVGITGFATGSTPTTDTAVVNCPSFVSKNYLPLLIRGQ